MAHHTVAKFNFWKGHPSTSLLPNREIIDATRVILNRFDNTLDDYNGLDDTHPLNYGPDLGNLEVRRDIAEWNDCKFKPKTKTDPNNINLTNGASFGLMNILLQLTSPYNGLTKKCFLVTPTYFLINNALIDAGFGGKLEGIQEFENGDIDLDHLETRLQELEAQSPSKKDITSEDIPYTFDPNRPMRKIYNYVIYLVPTFSNPKGGSVPEESRLRLVELARKYNMLIICDDVYDLLDYSSYKQPDHHYLKRVVTIDRETLPQGEEYGNTISNATFSKLIGPGLRVGWQESATDKLSDLLSLGGANMSGGTPAHLNTVIVSEMLRNGSVDRIVNNLCHVYGERAQVLKTSIDKYLPDGTTYTGLKGGYFSWVNLPDQYDNAKIIEECKKQGVFLAPGDKFEVFGDEKGWGKHGVRLSVSHLEKEKIEEGIKIWGQICKQFA